MPDAVVIAVEHLDGEFERVSASQVGSDGVQVGVFGEIDEGVNPGCVARGRNEDGRPELRIVSKVSVPSSTDSVPAESIPPTSFVGMGIIQGVYHDEVEDLEGE